MLVDFIFVFLIFQCCTACEEGEYSKDGNCLKCDSHCEVGECSDGVGCQKCKDRFFLNATQSCDYCVLNCQTCDGIYLSNCSKCLDGYYKDNKTQLCLQPMGCKEYEDWIGCTSCEDGFELENGYCVFQCEDCEDGFCSINQCDKCSNWFKYSDDKGKCTQTSIGKICLIIICSLLFILVFVGVVSTVILYAIKRRKQQEEVNYKEVN